MKWGSWFMILLAATFIVWSPYTGKIVQAETPQVPKKKTAEINPDNEIWDDIPGYPRFKILRDDKWIPPVWSTPTLVPSPPTKHSISRPRFQMVTNDKTGETFVLDRYDGAVWSSLPYARKFIQCPFVNALDNDKKTKEPNP